MSNGCLLGNFDLPKYHHRLEILDRKKFINLNAKIPSIHLLPSYHSIQLISNNLDINTNNDHVKQIFQNSIHTMNDTNTNNNPNKWHTYRTVCHLKDLLNVLEELPDTAILSASQDSWSFEGGIWLLPGKQLIISAPTNVYQRLGLIGKARTFNRSFK